MERSKIVLLALALGACATESPPLPAPVAAPVIVAPTPKSYTCTQEKRAADEFRNLPADSQIAVFIDDYRLLRKESWAAHKVTPPRCLR